MGAITWRRWLLALPWLLAGTVMPASICLAQAFPHTPGDYLRMMDASGDGKLDETEYAAYLSQGFSRMDRNGDGILDASELPGGRGQPIALKDFQDNLRRQFRKLDSNHDGYLSANELAQPPR